MDDDNILVEYDEESDVETEKVPNEEIELIPDSPINPNKNFWGFLRWLKNFWLSIWESKLKAFILFSIICAGLLIFVVAYTAYYGGFLHMNSDDLLQYYPYMANFFEKIKSGEVSFYDVNLFGGTNSFSGSYYIPLDIFSFIAFLLSFLMPGETAYAITNFLRPVAGAMIIYYAFSRRFSIKTAFISACILLIGGMTESYYIFPVYLGICFYAPLGMLLVDICTEKKGYWYLLVPVYSIAVIFYDFYIAYMILAFVCFYFLIAMFTRNQVSIIGKNTIIKNKEFWKRAGEFYGLLVLGVAMSAWFLLPNALYISHESSRMGSEIKESIWYFSKSSSTAQDYELSLKHYFTQFCNLFIPNEPHRLCLVSPGDYIREHASLYITCGGIIYLVYFLFLKSKEANRLKIWVLFFNIIYLIPVVSMFFSFSTVPYVRWFFMPYLINLYAMAMAMDDHDFKISENNFIKLAPAIFLTIGIVTLSYVVANSPSEFIHYKEGDVLFYPILIPSIVIMGIYLALMILSFVLRACRKEPKIIGKIIPLIIFIECGIGVAFILGNVTNTSSRYYKAKNQNLAYKDNLVDLYNYDVSDGYRINIYTAYGRDYVNNNIEIGNVNFGRFFQSFYSTPLNTCLYDIYHCTSTSISRTFNGGYTLLASPMFNMKYVITDENVYLPSKYYQKEIVQDGTKDVKYYALKDPTPFIVYDKGFSNISSQYSSGKYLFQQQIPLFYAYIKTTEKDDKVYNILKDKDFEFVNMDVINYDLSSYTKLISLNCNYRYENNGNTEYMYYKITDANKGMFKDAVLAWCTDANVRNQKEGFMYFGKLNDPVYDDDANTVTAGNPDKKWDTLYEFHYDSFYFFDDMDYNCLIVRNTENKSRYEISLYTYDFAIYDKFLATQNQYKDKYFKLDGDKMYIKCNMPDDSRTRIIKTAYAYSDDWKINDEGFETVNVDGGFLGVIVPKGVQNVDISLNFIPSGFPTGLKITIVGSIMYLAIIVPVITVKIVKRKREE